MRLCGEKTDAAGARPGRASTGLRSTSSSKYRGISRRLDGVENARIKAAARNAPKSGTDHVFPGCEGLFHPRNRGPSRFLARPLVCLPEEPLAECHDGGALGDDLRTHQVIGRLRL